MEALRPCTAEAGQICSLQARCAASGETFALPEPIAWTAPSSGDLVLKLTAAPVGSRPDGVVLAFNDVTDTVAAASRLLFEATHDPLTGLPNRTLLRDRLRVSLTQAERRQRLVALLFVDLDRFKRINDSLGHQCGDDVLRVVAERLTAAVRADDTVSRWGGDEFIILMDNLADRSAVVTVARKVLELIDREVRAPWRAAAWCCPAASASVSGPTTARMPTPCCRWPTRRCTAERSRAGGGYVFFSNDMNTWSRERLNMESALRQALEKREFELFYQPQIDIHSGTLVGLEALLRWRKPGEGLIPPDLFIPAAEEQDHSQHWRVDAARGLRAGGALERGGAEAGAGVGQCVGPAVFRHGPCRDDTRCPRGDRDRARAAEDRDHRNHRDARRGQCRDAAACDCGARRRGFDG